MILHDIEVLAVGGGIDVGYTGRLLADLGARVTVVVLRDPLHAKLSTAVRTGGRLFDYLLDGCRTLPIDLRVDEDGARLRGAYANADIFIEGLGTAEWEALTSTAHLESIDKPSVQLHLSEFGRSGPRRDRPTCGLTLQAMAGWPRRLVEPGQVPVFVGGDVDAFACGTHAAVAALTGWRHAQATESPVDAEVSTFECLVGMLPYPTLHAEILEAAGRPIPHFTPSLPGVVACADGWVGINPLNLQGWNDLCAVSGLSEYHDRMREVLASDAASEEFRARVSTWCRDLDADAVVELAQSLRIPSARVMDGATLLEDPHLVARGAFVAQPDAGFLRPRPPWRWRSRSHSHESANHAAAGQSWNGGRPDLPYSGLKVVDLTVYWAGPIVTMYLAAFGADVIKVESSGRPDPFRYSTSSPDLGSDWWERSAVWQGTNLDKRSLTLDLTHPEGRTLVRRLIAQADVFVENFTPRVLAHLGIDVEALHADNPRLITLRMPAFGLDGPSRDHVAWAPTFEQASGMAHMTGSREGPPIPPGGCADPLAGMHGLLAIQAALERRDRTGEGSAIELAQLEALLGLTAAQVIAASTDAPLPMRAGNCHPTLVPHGIYPCAGVDEWIAIAVDDDEWPAFVEAVGRPDLAFDARFATPNGRRVHHVELDAVITAWSSCESPDGAEAALVGAGVSAARVAHASSLRDDEQLRARDFFQAIARPATGIYDYPGWPMRFSFGPPTPHQRPAPTLGQHTDEILEHILGLTNDEIERLRRLGVL